MMVSVFLMGLAIIIFNVVFAVLLSNAVSKAEQRITRLEKTGADIVRYLIAEAALSAVPVGPDRDPDPTKPTNNVYPIKR